MIDDVVVVGAGPAGSIAAMLLARAGARVRLIDRETFPRAKLCGDTVNPGTLAILRRLRVSAGIEERGLRIEGMIVTGERGIRIEGRYPGGLHGRAILRRELDWLLLQQAVDAGAMFEPGVAVRGPIVEANGTRRVTGVVLNVVNGINGARRERHVSARVTIAADGRRSTIAFGLGLARHPPRPRRWAVGAYYADATGLTSCGEMHVRRGRYIGVAPLPGGLTNVCLVRPSQPADGALRDPAALLRDELAGDRLLADRFAAARAVAAPCVLGPLAVDSVNASLDGLLLAGDASGFVDPMTGDGLRFAVRGAELAAEAALAALEHGWSGVHGRLAAARQREFAGKWRFNRALRALVASPRVVDAAAFGAWLAPSVVRAVIARAGDCDAAR
jgi:menaquinone-9 beta-reductase